MKNSGPFYIVFEVLKVLLIKIYKIQPSVLLFLIVLHWLIHQQILFFTIFQNFIQHLKKDFRHQFLFFNRLTQTPHPLNDQNLLSVTKCGALRDLVAFVQFKKREKHPWRSVNFGKFFLMLPKVEGLKGTILELKLMRTL